MTVEKRKSAVGVATGAESECMASGVGRDNRGGVVDRDCPPSFTLPSTGGTN